MDLPESFLLDREDAKYLCNERTRGFAKMFNIVWEDIKHYFNFSLAHRFYDILFVVTKEEKTTTLASTCSSTEGLFAIKFG
jgi:hypothetical protein